MSKNYYPEMMDEIAKKDVSQQEILDWFYRHKPHSVIEAVQAVRKAKQPSKAEIDGFMARYSPDVPVKAEPAKPMPINMSQELANECRQLIKNHQYGRVSAIKLCMEKTGFGMGPATEIIDNLFDRSC